MKNTMNFDVKSNLAKLLATENITIQHNNVKTASFDVKNRVFQNGLGFRSQWFTKDELKSMLQSNVEPIPIDVMINEISYTFGNVFVDRSI